MRFINTSYENFIKSKKKIVQFGASSAWHYYINAFPNIIDDIVDNTISIVDNDLNKQGKIFDIEGRKFMIDNVDSICLKEDFVILIVVSLAYQKKICEQLLSLNLPDSVECYSLPLMTTFNKLEVNNDCVDTYFKTHVERVNVPIIHSFWFSGEEKPELYKRCIDSWHKYCPDFEIKEWNTGNYDVTKNLYMKQAYEQRKWAFVSDYARLDVVYRYGGIYMDMDVELLSSIEKFLSAKSFFCRQEDGFLELGSGFGACKGDEFIGEMLETYKHRKFILDNGKMDKTPQPEWLRKFFDKKGFKICHSSQVLGDTVVLSNDYITCFTGEGSIENARVGVHWHNGGWLDAKAKNLVKESFLVKKELLEKYFVL